MFSVVGMGVVKHLIKNGQYLSPSHRQVHFLECRCEPESIAVHNKIKLVQLSNFK